MPNAWDTSTATRHAAARAKSHCSRDHSAASKAAGPGGLDPFGADIEGVPSFHQKVRALARQIPPREDAGLRQNSPVQQGDLRAARAVGQALKHNPSAQLVPRHRILVAGARSGGFSATGGINTKLRMLLSARSSMALGCSSSPCRNWANADHTALHSDHPVTANVRWSHSQPCGLHQSNWQLPD